MIAKNLNNEIVYMNLIVYLFTYNISIHIRVMLSLDMSGTLTLPKDDIVSQPL